MDLDLLRAHCLAKPGTTEELPFDNDTLVYKVLGKMFALHSLVREPAMVSLKTDPEVGEELRAAHAGIEPAWHMHKKLWIQVHFDGDVSDAQLLALVDTSYALVAKKLRKVDKEVLRAQGWTG